MGDRGPSAPDQVPVSAGNQRTQARETKADARPQLDGPSREALLMAAVLMLSNRGEAKSGHVEAETPARKAWHGTHTRAPLISMGDRKSHERTLSRGRLEFFAERFDQRFEAIGATRDPFLRALQAHHFSR